MRQGDKLLVAGLVDWFGLASGDTGRGLNVMQARILLVLYRAGRPMTFAEIGTQAGCTQQPRSQAVHVCGLRHALPPASIVTTCDRAAYMLTEIGRAAVAEAIDQLVAVVIEAAGAKPRRLAA